MPGNTTCVFRSCRNSDPRLSPSSFVALVGRSSQEMALLFLDLGAETIGRPCPAPGRQSPSGVSCWATGRGGSPWREINNPCSAAQAWPLRLPRAIHTTTTSTAAVGLFVEFATTTVRDGSHLSRDDKGVLLHRMPSWPPLVAGVTFARVLARLASDVESLFETPDDGPCPSIRVDGGHIGRRCI